jgi:hypothetical protein
MERVKLIIVFSFCVKLSLATSYDSVVLKEFENWMVRELIKIKVMKFYEIIHRENIITNTKIKPSSMKSFQTLRQSTKKFSISSTNTSQIDLNF